MVIATSTSQTVLQIWGGVCGEKYFINAEHYFYLPSQRHRTAAHWKQKKRKNWFKLKYTSQEMSRQEITKAFSLLLTAHARQGNIPRQHTLLCLKKKKKIAVLRTNWGVFWLFCFLVFFITLCNYIYGPFNIFLWYFIQFYSWLLLWFLHPVVKKKIV